MTYILIYANIFVKIELYNIVSFIEHIGFENKMLLLVITIIYFIVLFTLMYFTYKEGYKWIASGSIESFTLFIVLSMILLLWFIIAFAFTYI